MRQPPNAATILQSILKRLGQFRQAQATGDGLMVKGEAWRIVFGALALLNDSLGGLQARDEARLLLSEVDLAIIQGRLVAPCPRCAHPAIEDREGNLYCLGCYARTPLTDATSKI